MSDRENCNISLENQEDVRKIAYEFKLATQSVSPSEEEIDRVCLIWGAMGSRIGVSALEFGKEQVALHELEKKIDAESETLEERRRRIENELGIPTEEQGSLDIAMDDFEWLEAKTGCRIEEIHQASAEHKHLCEICYANPDNAEAKRLLEHFTKKVESALSEAKKHLQSMLELQQKQSVKPVMNVPVKHTTPCARTASRAHRGASRPTFTQQGGGGSGDDDGDSDSSDSDPPGPGARARYLQPLTSHSKRNKFRYLNQRSPRCCWRVAEGGRAA
jgi:hypothetical protein